MATTATTIRRRRATPERWQAALARALAEGVQVRQLAGSGAWAATSGTDATAAYEVEVVGGVAHGCGCLAGANGDPVCKHRAAFYHAAGLLDPEPQPPAPAACAACGGDGFRVAASSIVPGQTFRATCRACLGSGRAPRSLRPAA